MLYTEWDWDKALAIHAEEAYEDGVAYGEKRGIELGEKRGVAKGLEQGISRGKEYGKVEERKKLIRALDGVLPAETIAEKFHLSKEYVLSVLQEPDACT